MGVCASKDGYQRTSEHEPHQNKKGAQPEPDIITLATAQLVSGLHLKNVKNERGGSVSSQDMRRSHDITRRGSEDERTSHTFLNPNFTGTSPLGDPSLYTSSRTLSQAAGERSTPRNGGRPSSTLGMDAAAIAASESEQQRSAHFRSGSHADSVNSSLSHPDKSGRGVRRSISAAVVTQGTRRSVDTPDSLGSHARDKSDQHTPLQSVSQLQRNSRSSVRSLTSNGQQPGSRLAPHDSNQATSLLASGDARTSAGTQHAGTEHTGTDLLSGHLRPHSSITLPLTTSPSADCSSPLPHPRRQSHADSIDLPSPLPASQATSSNNKLYRRPPRRAKSSLNIVNPPQHQQGVQMSGGSHPHGGAHARRPQNVMFSRSDVMVTGLPPTLLSSHARHQASASAATDSNPGVLQGPVRPRTRSELSGLPGLHVTGALGLHEPQNSPPMPLSHHSTHSSGAPPAGLANRRSTLSDGHVGSRSGAQSGAPASPAHSGASPHKHAAHRLHPSLSQELRDQPSQSADGRPPSSALSGSPSLAGRDSSSLAQSPPTTLHTALASSSQHGRGEEARHSLTLPSPPPFPPSSASQQPTTSPFLFNKQSTDSNGQGTPHSGSPAQAASPPLSLLPSSSENRRASTFGPSNLSSLPISQASYASTADGPQAKQKPMTAREQAEEALAAACRNALASTNRRTSRAVSHSTYSSSLTPSTSNLPFFEQNPPLTPASSAQHSPSNRTSNNSTTSNVFYHGRQMSTTSSKSNLQQMSSLGSSQAQHSFSGGGPGPPVSTPTLSASNRSIPRLGVHHMRRASTHCPPSGDSSGAVAYTRKSEGADMHSGSNVASLNSFTSTGPDDWQTQGGSSSHQTPNRCSSESSLKPRASKEFQQRSLPPQAMPEHGLPPWVTEEAGPGGPSLMERPSGHQPWSTNTVPDMIDKAYEASAQVSSMGVDFAFDDDEGNGSAGSRGSEEEDGGEVEFKYDMSGASRPEIVMPARYRSNTAIQPVRNRAQGNRKQRR